MSIVNNKNCIQNSVDNARASIHSVFYHRQSDASWNLNLTAQEHFAKSFQEKTARWHILSRAEIKLGVNNHPCIPPTVVEMEF